jgi:hypothetical protein
MTIGFPFGVGALSSLNTGFGDLVVKISTEKARAFVYQRSIACRSLGFGKADRRAASGAKGSFGKLAMSVSCRLC